VAPDGSRPSSGKEASTRPWRTIDRVEREDGVLELRRRGPGDFHLCLDGRILMQSRASRSEQALGRLAAEAIAGQSDPRMLVAGLGMGHSLRAALHALPPSARVVAAELEPRVRDWLNGALREVCGGALEDPRVEVVIGDVADRIRAASGEFDAIALDLYEGVRPWRGDPDRDPFYGGAALARARRALRPEGVFARWCEQDDPAFEARLAAAGFRVEPHRIGRGGRRHVVYLAMSGAPS
jgi:spermidine synthase